MPDSRHSLDTELGHGAIGQLSWGGGCDQGGGAITLLASQEPGSGLAGKAYMRPVGERARGASTEGWELAAGVLNNCSVQLQHKPCQPSHTAHAIHGTSVAKSHNLMPRNSPMRELPGMMPEARVPSWTELSSKAP